MARSENVFRALGDPTRQRILQALVRQELNVSELVEVLAQPQSTISRHLKVLKEADLILDHRQGTSITYSSPAVDENGQAAADIRHHVLTWAAEQPLPRPVARRLDAVVHQRRLHSDRFFEQIGHRWDQMRVDCFGTAFPLEALTALLPGEWAVGDIGAGTGYLLPLLARRFRRVVAVDPVPAMLDIARDRPDLAGRDNIDFRVGDLSGLPLETGEMDLLLAILVLHHVPSPAEALAELARVLRPGGRLLVVEHAAHHCEEFHDKMQDRWWGFDPDDLARRVHEAGFAITAKAPLQFAEPTTPAAPEAPDLFLITAERIPSPGSEPQKETRNETTQWEEPGDPT